MHNLLTRHLNVAVASASLFLIMMPTFADYTRITFTATVTGVEDDIGGTFTGVGVSDTFMGEFNIGTSAAEASFITEEENDTEYLFSGNNYGATITSGSASFSRDQSWLFIENNGVVDAEDAAFVNEVFGLNLSPGDMVDTWGLLVESQGSIWDDNLDCLVNGLEFEIVLADVDATMFNDTTFRAEPPSQADIELAAFFLEEASGSAGCDNIVYSAYGTITDIQYELVEEPVPEPQPGNKGLPWLPILIEE